MESCVARQPIFNKSMKIFGYELLYRFDNESTSFQGEVSSDTATSETIFNSFHSIDIQKVTNKKYAFINFTERLLLDEVATLLPSELLVIEILENIQPTEEVLNACKSLKSKGYLLALDDFVLKQEFAPFLPLAGIIKVDFLNTPIEVIKRSIPEMKKYKAQLLAEKLETNKDFELAKSLGFTLFQGFFFSKPVIVNTVKKLSPLDLNKIQLIKLAFDPNVNYPKIAEIIKHDTALTFRLFRVVNSVYFGIGYKVNSVRQALSILGMNEIKKWITLISMSQICSGKPSELITMSLIRAKFMELIAPRAGLASSSEDMFLVGLMSLMDVITDNPMEEIVRLTCISSSIADPLLQKTGMIGDILSLITYYEDSNWTEVQNIAIKYGISIDKISQAYLQAVIWSDGF